MGTQPERFWGDRAGAVSLTFDDGTPNQLENALPPLDERGLKGTFYVAPRTADWASRLAPWKDVAARGHELGNHTLSHTCSANYGFQPGGLEAMRPEDMEADILAAQERLEQLAPHQQQWTFAYPCYCTYVGRGTGRQSYVPVVARHFLAGRTGCEYGFCNNPAKVDLACFWGLPVERMSGFEMIGLVEELTFRGQWVVLVLHQVDGSSLAVSSSDYNRLLDYLVRKQETVWTAPVVDVARYIARQQEQA